MDDAPDVLIVGASGRAAVQSAVRAGWRPWVVDLFGDADLVEAAYRHHVISDYRELPAVIADWPALPWMFTGAVENHFGLIRRLAKKGPLWGTPLEAIRGVRNPLRLAEVLRAGGCSTLEIWTDATPPPPDGRWMLKPRRTAGGQGITIWDSPTAAQSHLRKQSTFQERAKGEALSAVFLSSEGQTQLVGISRLLHANHPAAPFGYGGAIGPVRLVPELERQVQCQGECVGRAFELRGLWGLDFVGDGDRVWATEVNPRYTATVELYEHAYGVSLLAAHQRVCDRGELRLNQQRTRNPPNPLPPGERGQNAVQGERGQNAVQGERGQSATQGGRWGAMQGERGQNATQVERPRDATQVEWGSNSPLVCIGKAVIYAKRDFKVPSWGTWIAARDELRPELPCLADRPDAGSRVLRGHPICSVLASGQTEHECRRALQQRLWEFQSHFEQFGVPASVPGIGN